MKNIRIGVKLIAVSTAIMLCALGIVTYVAVSQSGAGLSRLGKEDMENRARDIAKIIDMAYMEEMKTAQIAAINPDVVAAAEAIEEKGWAKAADAIRRANKALMPYGLAKDASTTYESVYAADLHGVVFASSNPSSLGINASDRGYMKNALKGNANVGDVAVSKDSGRPVSPVAMPIVSNGQVIGACVLVMQIQFLNDIIVKERIGKTGYAVIVDTKGIVIAHPKADYILKLNTLETEGMREFAKDMIDGKNGVARYVLNGEHKTAGYAPVSSTGWSTFLTLSDSDDTFLAVSLQIERLLLMICAAAIVVAFLANLAFARSITAPLIKGVRFAELVAAGDLTQHLDIHQKDEVGKLAEALNGMSGRLKDMVATIQDCAGQVASSSEEISASAQSLAEGSQSQASTLEETSASVEELTSSVDQVSQNAQSQAAAVAEGSQSMARAQESIDEISSSLNEISELANESVSNALDGANAVTQVVEGIHQIADSSDKIAGIVTVISDIADQTNLLALNASIEAARAGEHGRGFAVVADEVSKLADRSSTSTKEIEGLIKESVKNVTKGVERAQGSQGAMEKIRVASQKVKDMIVALSQSMSQQVSAVKELTKSLENVNVMSQNISAATEQQTTSSKQAAQAVENVNELTQQAATAAEEMSSSTAQLSDLAQQLQRLTAQFKISRDEEGGEGKEPDVPAVPVETGEAPKPRPGRRVPALVLVESGHGQGRDSGRYK